MLRNHIADNTVKIITVLFALIIYFILSGIYLLLRFIVVRQLFINKLLTLIIDIAPLSLKLLALIFCDNSYNLSKEIINLLAKIGKFLALFQFI